MTSTDTKTTNRSKHTNITEEEQSLLAQEGIVLPTDVPLTKVYMRNHYYSFVLLYFTF